jgi:uncharacterized membrane protein YbhN (UPF0104 family)
VTEDIRAITSPVSIILDLAVSILMNTATLLMPAAVMISALLRRQLMLALQGFLAGIGGFALARASTWAIEQVAWEPLTEGMSVVAGAQYQVAIAPLAALMSGVLTAMGPRSRRPVVSVAWNILWVALAAWVLTGGATLPAAFISVLIGRMAGLAIRYALGVHTDRATGDALVIGIRGAGLDPVRIVRVRDISEPESPTDRLDVRSIRDGTYRPETDPVDDAVPQDPAASPAKSTPSKADPVKAVGAQRRMSRAERVEAAVSDSTSRALERAGGNRIYAVYGRDGERRDAIVLDGDMQVLGFLQATWRALRLRGMDRRAVRSLRQAAERAALLGYAASAAGVRTPHLVGVGEAADSMMLLQAHPKRLRSLDDLRPAEVSDAALIDAWHQLDLAHRAGIAHRNITAASLLFGESGDEQQVWLIGWENGDIASSELARNLDRAQMAALLGLKVGPERAIASAAAVLPSAALASLAGLLQPVVFPAATRELARSSKPVIEAVRQALLDQMPDTPPVVPFRLIRFGWRTVLVVAMTLIAIWAVVTKLNFSQMMDAISRADPVWMIVSFGLSMATYVGAGMTLASLTPGHISPWRTILSQVAASFMALSMPAAVGPMAISLRFLNRQGVRTSLAVATVALSQVALFLVTVLLLAASALVTGDTGVLSDLPVGAIVAVALTLAMLGCLLLIPRLRAWIWAKAGPTFNQVWPRVIWVLGQPKRLILALTGTVIQFGGYVAAFWAALICFGLTDLPLGAVVLVYLLGNVAGSAAPTPGGLGGVEIALTAGLRAIDVATGTAASAAVLFRVITYWARVPLGWIAFRYLSRRGDL